MSSSMATDNQKNGEANLSQEELARRVAVVRRFKELLVQQRDRFKDYISVLDRQKDVIEQGNAEALISHVEREEQLVADIFAIQKVIDPMESMYRTVNPGKESEVPSIKVALDELKAEATVRAKQNRELLTQRMAQMRMEIKNLRNNPYASRRSVYADSGTPSLVDIKG
jgi:hypothetical protein